MISLNYLKTLISTFRVLFRLHWKKVNTLEWVCISLSFIYCKVFQVGYFSGKLADLKCKIISSHCSVLWPCMLKHVSLRIWMTLYFWKCSSVTFEVVICWKVHSCCWMAYWGSSVCNITPLRCVCVCIYTYTYTHQIMCMFSWQGR